MALGHWLKDYLKDYIGPHDDNGGGGGGESDFSTAQVTVVNNTSAETAIGLLMTIINEDGDLYVTNGLPSGTYTVPLLNGALYIAYLGLSAVSVSGNASEEDGDITITGDCTITIS